MAKWFGKVGYRKPIETSPGIWEEEIVEIEYYGDFIRNTRRLNSTSDSVNDNLKISNRISIISDPYAMENFHQILYAEYMGIKWKVEDVDPEFPRLILSLGEVYNE